MILYVFNQPYPDDSGFSRRCKREIEALSILDEVVVLCRYSKGQKLSEEYTRDGNQIKIIRFTAKSEIVHRPENYKGNGLYELRRNIDLMLSLCGYLFSILLSGKDKEKKLYVVSSPLTVPFIAWIIGTICGANTWALSMHDLEPELAMHIKHLKMSHWIVKVELFLEAILCKVFKKVIVTTTAQALRIHERTHQSLEKICAIENATGLVSDAKKTERIFPTDSLTIVYMSTLSFDYTLSGFLDLLQTFHQHEKELSQLKILVLGNGEGKATLQNKIEEYALTNKVRLLGKVTDPTIYLRGADLAIVPWQRDSMTETMLPTKVFEYLSIRIPVIVPRFGEFLHTFTDKDNALFYSDQTELLHVIQYCLLNRNQTRKIGEKGYRLYEKKYLPVNLNKKFISFLLRT